MKKNHIVLLISVVIIILGIFLAKLIIDSRKQAPAPVKAETVKYAEIKKVEYNTYPIEIHTSGRVEPAEKVELFAEVQGIYRGGTKEFREGNRFNKGDILVKIDSEEIDLELKTLKSEFLSRLTSIMPDIKMDFAKSYNSWINYLDNFDISTKIKELPEPKSRKEKYFLSTNNILNSYYNIKTLELRLSKHNIYAPYNGFVSQGNLVSGTLIRTGNKIGEFAKLNEYEISATFKEDDMNFIKTNREVKIIKDELVSTGKIVRISDMIDQSSQTIKVFIKSTDNKLKIGDYIKVVAKSLEIKDAFKIPREAIINNLYVHILDNGLLGRKEVEILYSGETYSYIKGLDKGTEVIIEAIPNTELGTKIVAKD